MGASCIVKNCSNYQGKKNIHVKFHSIPSDWVIRNEWLYIVENNVGVKVKLVTDKSVICSDHFSVESYVANSNRLLKTAKPSIFRKDPEGLPPTKKHRADEGRIMKNVLNQLNNVMH